MHQSKAVVFRPAIAEPNYVENKIEDQSPCAVDKGNLLMSLQPKKVDISELDTISHEAYVAIRSSSQVTIRYRPKRAPIF